jgi:hypothetical protein
MYAGWGFLGVVAVFAVSGALSSQRWLARTAGALLMLASVALLIYVAYRVPILRPFADQITFEGMGRPFIQAPNRYVAGAMFWAVMSFAIFVFSNTFKKPRE